MGGASGYINGRVATASQISSLQRRRPFFADAEICHWSTSAAGLGPLAATSLQTRSSPCGYPVRSKNALLEEHISAQRCCKCRAVIVRCAGIPCTLMTLTLSVCHTWGNPTLRSAGLNACTASFLFRERLSPSRPLVFFLPGICVKKTAGRGFERPVTSELMLAQCSRASPSPQRKRAFARPLHSTWSASHGCERHDLVRCELRRNRWQPFFWQLRTQRSYRALWPTPPYYRRPLHIMPDSERMKSSSASWQSLSMSSGSNGLRWGAISQQDAQVFSHGALSSPPPTLVPLLSRSSYELTILWHAPHSSRIRPSASAALTSVDGAEEKGYEHLPPMVESVAAHLCPPTAIGWKARSSQPSKLCRATSALAGHAYSVAGQAASALHSMAVLQVFQVKMLASEEAGLNAASLRDLRRATDLALRTTNATAQAIGRSMSSLIVLECHLWLTMEMKEAGKVLFLDAPVSSGSLFGAAVEGFAERFMEAQKSSQAMRHFLPKRTSSSAAFSRPRPVPTQKTAKPTPATPEPWPPEGRQDRGRSYSARCYPFSKRQGPRPKIA